MDNQRPLGIIRDVSGGFSYDTLAVFPDSLVLVKGSFGYMVLRSLSVQFGALGVLLFEPLIKRSQAKQLAAISRHSPAELAQLKPKNRVIPQGQVLDAQLKKSFVTGRLTLKLADGTTQKWSWPKGANKYEDVAPLLRQVLGPKLFEAA